MTEWSEHVKRYAKRHKMSYRQASMNGKCKEAYQKKKKRMSPRRMKMPSRAGGGAREEDLPRNERERAGRILRSRRIGIEEPEYSREYPSGEGPCHKKGRYKCSNCRGQTDMVYLDPIPENKGVCIDKQCYNSDHLIESFEKIGEIIPHNSQKMTLDELDDILENGEDHCMTLTKKDLKGTSKEEKVMLLLRACEIGYSKGIKLILNYKLDINNITNEFGSTPLILAVISGSTEAVNLLLSRGADPNKETPTGDTALSFAISSDVPEEISELLLNAGVDPNKEIHEMTPITSALLERKIDIVRILLDHGAYPNRNSSYNGRNTYEILKRELRHVEREIYGLTSYYSILEEIERLEEDERILEQIRDDVLP